MSVDGRRAWQEWAARELGGDPIRQDAAVTAALNALAAGHSPEEAANAGRMAAGLPTVQPPPLVVPVPQMAPVAGGPLVCRFCGSAPAMMATVHEHNGYLVMFQHKRLAGPYCRSCGIAVLRRMTNATMLRGWLGIFSFVITPATLVINFVTWLRIRALPPRAEGPVAPIDPGAPLYMRPGVYVYSVAMIGIIVFFAISSLGPKGCYSDKSSLQNAVIKAHDEEVAKADAATDRYDACATLDCVHQAALDSGQAYDNFNTALKPLCFAGSETAHADALITANKAVAAAARVIAQADGAHLDAAIADFNGKIDAAHAALRAMYRDLDITIRTT